MLEFALKTMKYYSEMKISTFEPYLHRLFPSQSACSPPYPHTECINIDFQL